MATIRGETNRGLHLLPNVGPGQAAFLGLAAAAAWGLWRVSLPEAVRWPAVALVAGAGAALALGHWPPGPRGERLPVWGARIGRFLAQPRWWRGGRAFAARAGVRGLTAGGLRRAGRDCRVLWCAGRDHGAAGPGALEAAQAAYLEFLHGLEGSLQVVSCVRRLSGADRPATWGASGAPAGLADIGAHYASHWGDRVAGRLCLRTQVAVLSAPPQGPGSPPSIALAETEAAFRAFADRAGISLAAPEPEALAAHLRELLGEPGRLPAAAGTWRVTRATVGTPGE